jgi:tetratricopeptide (TPR) repeat protein
MRANIFKTLGKLELVAAEAQALTRDNADSSYAWVAAGKTYAALGKREKAIESIDRALAIHPYAYIYINRAEVRAADDVAGRLADLDAALKLEPDNSDALAAKARLLLDKGDRKGALGLVDRIKPQPLDLHAELRRGILLYKLGRMDEARKILDMVRTSSKSAAELNSLCWAKATADILLQSALEDCEASLKLDPESGSSEDSLGMVLLKLGRLDESLQAYDKAIARKTGAASLMGRAFVYLRKGDRADAEADAAAARKIAPDIDETFATYGLKFDEDRKDATTVAR